MRILVIFSTVQNRFDVRSVRVGSTGLREQLIVPEHFDTCENNVCIERFAGPTCTSSKFAPSAAVIFALTCR